MAGSEAQAGFYYQNIVAAGYALDLVEFGSQLQSLTFDNPRRAKHIDDVVASYVAHTEYVQVKWSQEDTSAFTLHNLTTASGDESVSLLTKLARGFQQIREEGGRREIVLLSTRKPGTNRHPSSGLDKSLREFIDELHTPFVRGDLTDLRQTAVYEEYKEILERLLRASELADLDELSQFLKCLRFRLGQPDRDTMAERVRARLSKLGIEQAQYATLLDEIVKWSITGQEVQREDVLRALGLLDRFVDQLSHSFRVDREVWVPTPELFDKLDSSIGTLESGFVLLEGEPGSGKSTALTMYLSECPDVLFGYYCYIPEDRSIGNERLGADAFVRSICIGLRNAFPDVDLPQPYANFTINTLNQWLGALTSQNKRVVFVVDGVDHVDRKNRQSLIVQPLTHLLDGKLPRNVLIVLSSRYAGALPRSVREHIESDPRRHIEMPRFKREQAQNFFRLRGVRLADDLLDTALEVSGGVPIYLEYLADRLDGRTHFEQKSYLESVPTLRDKRIDHYHEHLWEECAGDERCRYLLAILAVREDFTTPETLRDLLRALGLASTTLDGVHDAINGVRHVLRSSDAKSVAIRHSSLVEFVSERTRDLRGEINRVILQWYTQHPDTDEAWRHQLRHLFQAGEYTSVLSTCDDAWLERAWSCHRPIREIQQNLDVAWQAASMTRDFLGFIRIALVKQRLALVDQNLALSSEAELARLLLDMGHPEEALMRVWDGERRRCRAVDFARFSLAHLARTGRILPKNILDAGLGDAPEFGSSIEDNKIWSRARVHSAAPVRLLVQIGKIRWQTKDAHRHLRRQFAEDQNRTMNLEVQLAVIRELAKRPDLEALEAVQASDSLPEVLRIFARAAIGLAFLRAGEKKDAIAEIQCLDLSSIPQNERRWLLLELAPWDLNILAPLTVEPPRLPENLVELGHEELDDALFALYDELRCYFLRDANGFPWLEAWLTGAAEPARSVIGAIGRLAWLWTCSVRKTPTKTPAMAELRSIASELDLPRRAFGELRHAGDFAEHVYRRGAYRFYEQVWSCASRMLSGEEFEDLAQWWVENGERALRYPEATQGLAVAIQARVTNASRLTVRALLELSERSARQDEDTALMTVGLRECIAGWGRCAFPDEAERLWRELLDVACGVHWRKDYQFNEIITALELAHAQDPAGTLKRVEEQLTLAHQLVGTSRPNTVQVAIEALLAFVAPIDPGLALEGIAREESFVYRNHALRSFVLALLEKGDAPHRLLLALVGTMARWKNYTEFDDATKPTIFAVYSSALAKGDIDTARKAYDAWRQILFIEKAMPEELGRWAAEWAKTGAAPADILRDYANYPPPEEEGERSGSTQLGTLRDEGQLEEELDRLATGSLSKLEQRIDEVEQKAIIDDRRRQLSAVLADWRTVFDGAVGRALSEDESRWLDERLKTFAENEFEVPTDSTPASRKAVRQSMGRLVDAVSEKLGATVTVERFEELFDVDGWLDRFFPTKPAQFLLERAIEKRLPAWIAVTPISRLRDWEDFCRRRCEDTTKAAGLLALARRYAALDRKKAVAYLHEAWESASDFFHEHTKLANTICAKLLELHSEKGLSLLFESFRKQYQRFPGSIVYRLDNLLSFATQIPRFDAVQLYEIWSSHNRRLATGLSKKTVDLSWLKPHADENFEDAGMKYLINLFDYPVVDVRLLAFDELFRLLIERDALIARALDTWSGLGHGQKEYLATLMFSLGIAKPISAEHWAPRLVELVQKEPHHNLRATVADAVEEAVRSGVKLAPDVIADARALKGAALLVLAQTPSLHTGLSGRMHFPPLLRSIYDDLSRYISPQKLGARMRTALAALAPALDRYLADEARVHKTYNLNGNFDVIELSGPYDRVARAALNRVVQEFVDSREIGDDALRMAQHLLRLRDPSDVLVRRVPRPLEVAWLDPTLSAEEFQAFTDMAKLQAGYGLRDGEWVTLFEYTEQRAAGGSGAVHIQEVIVTLFGVARGGTPPSVREMLQALGDGALPLLRNRYRFELSRMEADSSWPRLVSILVASKRSFRGRPSPHLAAFDTRLARTLGLVPDDADPFGYRADSEQVVRSIEWQEAFDQGRRLHEPSSVGFLLQVKREFLSRIADAEGLDFWAYIAAARAANRYEPEADLDWAEHNDVVPVTILVRPGQAV